VVKTPLQGLESAGRSPVSTTTSTDGSSLPQQTDNADSHAQLPTNLPADDESQFAPSTLPQQGNAASQAQRLLSDIHALDLTDIAFGANTTLGYAPNASGIGAVAGVNDGTHNASIALFSQFAAAGFQLGNNNNGALVTNPLSVASDNEMLITNPNHKP
jgi:hypothetical protein